eukprot:6198631-Pleurochrysis_carterae.AAC.2
MAFIPFGQVRQLILPPAPRVAHLSLRLLLPIQKSFVNPPIGWKPALTSHPLPTPQLPPALDSLAIACQASAPPRPPFGVAELCVPCGAGAAATSTSSTTRASAASPPPKSATARPSSCSTSASRRRSLRKIAATRATWARARAMTNETAQALCGPL